MGRGTELAEGISLAETSPHGIVTTVHFRGDTIVVQRSQDMQDALAYVAEQRERLRGLPWGTGREVGYIPELFYSQIKAIPDPDERKRAVRQFFVDNPAFLYFDNYLKKQAPREAAPVMVAVATDGTDSIIAGLDK